MKKACFLYHIVLVSFLIVVASGILLGNDGSLKLTISGLRNDNGVVRGAVFASKDGFPFDSSKAVKTFQSPIKDGKASVRIEGLSLGVYAISVYHDEKNIGKLELGAFGKPKEGIGASNNPPKRNRAPKFEEAQFNFSADNEEINISMLYY